MERKTNNPRVVAIGASAGGLKAFQKLIENLFVANHIYVLPPDKFMEIRKTAFTCSLAQKTR